MFTLDALFPLIGKRGELEKMYQNSQLETCEMQSCS